MTESAELPAVPTSLAPQAEASASGTAIVPPPLEIGSRVGSFELRRLIAQGPSTAVYLAHDANLGVDVAIKEFRLARGVAQQPVAGSSTGSPTHVQLEPAVVRGLRAFVEEARMLARCSHPSLMSVRGLFESRGTAYRVMPYYTATGLTELRASMPRPPDEPSVRAVLNHLLSALEALHANGQVHGALVADNVLLLPDDRPLLLGPGSAAREAAFVQAAAQAQQHPGAAAPVFADKVSGELRDLADLAEFCITGVQRPAGHVREAGDTVTASIVRELGAVELRHYSPAFLSVLDVASSARSEDRPLNTAQFANWLGSHELRRLKHQPPQTLVPTRADDARARQDEWAVTVPPALWNEPAPEVATPSPADREFAQPQDSVSTSQIWADTVQVVDDNPPPAKRATVYPPQPLPQVRPNFEQRRWEARKWMAGLGVAGVGLIAALVYVVGGSKDATPPSDAGAARTASTSATSAAVAVPNAATRPAAAALPVPPAARNVTPENPSTVAAVLPAAASEMPEIRLPVAAPFSAASAASASGVTTGAAVPVAVAAAVPVAAAAVQAALPRTEPPQVKTEPKPPASSKPPKGVKMSKAAWTNGPRAVCSARTAAAAGSCLKTQCRSRKWVSHPQCTRAAGAKAAG
jgi:Protein tyrosine and serine/threonine kinase